MINTLLQILELCRSIKRRTCFGSEVPMPVNARIGKSLTQSTKELKECLLLLFCARVLAMVFTILVRHGLTSTDVADPD